MHVSLPLNLLTLLLASLMGSWHCVGMCSAICLNASRQKHGLGAYHLGRGLSYVAFGALAGLIGEHVIRKTPLWFSSLAAVLMALLLITIGLKSWGIPWAQNFILRLESWGPFGLLQKSLSRSTSSFSLGLLSVFLPCGWLYSFVLVAATTAHTITGALVLLIFWLGTLPALSAVVLFVNKSLDLETRQSRQKWAGFLIVLSGIYSLISHFVFSFH